MLLQASKALGSNTVFHVWIEQQWARLDCMSWSGDNFLGTLPFLLRRWG